MSVWLINDCGIVNLPARHGAAWLCMLPGRGACLPGRHGSGEAGCAAACGRGHSAVAAPAPASNQVWGGFEHSHTQRLPQGQPARRTLQGMPTLATPDSWISMTAHRTSWSIRSARGMKAGISVRLMSLPAEVEADRHATCRLCCCCCWRLPKLLHCTAARCTAERQATAAGRCGCCLAAWPALQPCMMGADRSMAPAAADSRKVARVELHGWPLGSPFPKRGLSRLLRSGATRAGENQLSSPVVSVGVTS